MIVYPSRLAVIAFLCLVAVGARAYDGVQLGAFAGEGASLAARQACASSSPAPDRFCNGYTLNRDDRTAGTLRIECSQIDPWGPVSLGGDTTRSAIYWTDAEADKIGCFFYDDDFCSDGSAPNGLSCDSDDVVDPSKSAGAPSGQSCPVAGNPINFGVGNKFALATDYADADAMGLMVRRYFNSSPTTIGGIDPVVLPWSFSFSERLVIPPNRSNGSSPYPQYHKNTHVVMHYVRDDGKAYQFTKDSGEQWVGPRESQFELSFVDGGTSYWCHDKWSLTDGDGSLRTFNSHGQLERIEWRNGQYVDIEFDSSDQCPSSAPPYEVVGATDHTGQSLQFDYLADGDSRTLDSVTDDAGNVFRYCYDAYSRLEKVVFPDGNDVSVTCASTGDNPFITYAYQGSTNRLTAVIDEEGQSYATWTYDASSGFADSSFHGASKDLVTLDYTDTDGNTYPDSVVEVGPLGLSTTNVMTVQQGVPQLSARQRQWSDATSAGDELYHYDDNGYPSRRDDFEGRTTLYRHDASGLLRIRVDAFDTAEERLTRITWDQSLRQPLKIERGGSLRTSVNRADLAAGTYVLDPAIDFVAPGATDPFQVEEFLYYPDAADPGNASPDGLLRERRLLDGNDVTVPARRWTYHYTNLGSIELSYGPRATGPRASLATYLDEAALLAAEGATDVMLYEYNGNHQLDRIKEGDSYPLSTLNAGFRTILHVVNRDARGYVTELVGRTGTRRLLSYDGRGRLKSLTVGEDNSGTGGDDECATTTYSYYKNSLLERVTEPNGAYLHYEYDAARRVTRISNNLGESIVYDGYGTDAALDDAGNRIVEHIRDSSNTIVWTARRQFDELSRIREVLGNDTTQPQDWDFAYYNEGNLTNESDALGRTVVASYDPLDRLTSQLDPDGITERFSVQYDERDNVVSVEDAKGVVTDYSYNALDDLLQESSPDSGTSVHSYDVAGNRTQTVDGRGLTSTYSYDDAGPLEKIEYPGAASESKFFIWDNSYSGEALVQAFDQNETSLFRVFNSRGDVVREQIDLYGGPITTMFVDYGRDVAGNVTTLNYPHFGDTSWCCRQVRYNRDSLGRIASIEFDERIDAQKDSGDPAYIASPVWKSIVSSVEYAPFGPVVRWTSGNGLVNDRALDKDYRPKCEKVIDNGTPLTQRLHETHYDAADRLTAISGGTSDQSFGYDDLDRLIDATGAYGVLGYVYDDNGNRTGVLDKSVNPPVVAQSATYSGNRIN